MAGGHIGSYQPYSSIAAWGGNIGKSLGTGLSSGLQALAEKKLKGLESKERQRKHQEAGLTAKEAYLLDQYHEYPAQSQKLLSQFLQNSGGGSDEESMAQPDMMESYNQQESQQNSFMNAISSMPQQQKQQLGQLLQQLQNPAQAARAIAQPNLQQLQGEQGQQQNQLAEVLKRLSNPGSAGQEIAQQSGRDIPQNIPSEEPYKFPEAPQRQSVPQTVPPRRAEVLSGKRPSTASEFEQSLAREKFEEQKQNKIDTNNARDLKPFKEQGENVARLEAEVKKALALIDTGKTASGAAGAAQALSKRFQNQETQELNKTLNDIVNYATAAQRGPVTLGKLRAQERAKPSLDNDKQVQKNILQSYLDEIVNPFEDRLKIMGNLIDENGGKQPKDLWLGIERQYRKLAPELTKEANEKKQQQYFSSNFNVILEGESIADEPPASKYVGTNMVLMRKGIPHYATQNGWGAQKSPLKSKE